MLDSTLLDLLERLSTGDEDLVTDSDLQRLRDGLMATMASVTGTGPDDLVLLSECQAAMALLKSVFARRGHDWVHKGGTAAFRQQARKPTLPSMARLAARAPGRTRPTATATDARPRRST